jgi:hypothetical protein
MVHMADVRVSIVDTSPGEHQAKQAIDPEVSAFHMVHMADVRVSAEELVLTGSPELRSSWARETPSSRTQRDLRSNYADSDDDLPRQYLEQDPGILGQDPGILGQRHGGSGYLSLGRTLEEPAQEKCATFKDLGQEDPAMLEDPVQENCATVEDPVRDLPAGNGSLPLPSSWPFSAPAAEAGNPPLVHPVRTCECLCIGCECA